MVPTLRCATDDDLPFARELTRANMRPYYELHALSWHEEAFDAEWGVRRSHVIVRNGKRVGFFSYSLEKDYLYIRDVQLMALHRGEGVGGWALDHIARIAKRCGVRAIRLKVFKGNPAIGLYRRQGFSVIGEERALLWMERILAG